MTECVHGAFMVFIVVGLDIPVETSVYENFSLMIEVFETCLHVPSHVS